MNLIPTDEQNQLRDVVRKMLSAIHPPDVMRKELDAGHEVQSEAWVRLTTELGVPALAVSTSGGGFGFGLSELCVAMEECGASLVGGPLLHSGVVAAQVLDAVGETTLLPSIVSGERIAAVVLGEGLSYADSTISGRALVLGGMQADVLVVLAHGQVRTVEVTDPGLHLRPIASLDPTRRWAEVTFASAPSQLIGDSAGADVGLDRARVALAAESLGVMRQCSSLTVDYAKSRVQFGRPIGSFQAVKHGLADLYADLELASAAVSYAAWAADEAPDELPLATSVATAFVLPKAFNAAMQAIQFHGGIGFTWEHNIHLYYKRAKANETLIGSRGASLDRISSALLD